MQPDGTRDIPAKFRPSGDGRFLYPFRGRSYLLTREQYLHQHKLSQHWSRAFQALGFFSVTGFVFSGGFPWSSLAIAGFLVSILVCLLGLHWRIRVLLKGCDYREAPKTKSTVARVVRWLEYKRSLHLSDDLPATRLLLYCLAFAAMFFLTLFALWLVHAKHDGLEFAMEAVFCGLASTAWFVGSAILFYAFRRATAKNGTGASGSATPPNG